MFKNRRVRRQALATIRRQLRQQRYDKLRAICTGGNIHSVNALPSVVVDMVLDHVPQQEFTSAIPALVDVHPNVVRRQFQNRNIVFSNAKKPPNPQPNPFDVIDNGTTSPPRPHVKTVFNCIESHCVRLCVDLRPHSTHLRLARKSFARNIADQIESDSDDDEHVFCEICRQLRAADKKAKADAEERLYRRTQLAPSNISWMFQNRRKLQHLQHLRLVGFNATASYHLTPELCGRLRSLHVRGALADNQNAMLALLAKCSPELKKLVVAHDARIDFTYLRAIRHQLDALHVRGRQDSNNVAKLHKYMRRWPQLRELQYHLDAPASADVGGVVVALLTDGEHRNGGGSFGDAALELFACNRRLADYGIVRRMQRLAELNVCCGSPTDMAVLLEALPPLGEAEVGAFGSRLHTLRMLVDIDGLQAAHVGGWSRMRRLHTLDLRLLSANVEQFGRDVQSNAAVYEPKAAFRPTNVPLLLDALGGLRQLRWVEIMSGRRIDGCNVPFVGDVTGEMFARALPTVETLQTDVLQLVGIEEVLGMPALRQLRLECAHVMWNRNANEWLTVQQAVSEYRRLMMRMSHGRMECTDVHAREGYRGMAKYVMVAKVVRKYDE